MNPQLGTALGDKALADKPREAFQKIYETLGEEGVQRNWPAVKAYLAETFGTDAARAAVSPDVGDRIMEGLGSGIGLINPWSSMAFWKPGSGQALSEYNRRPFGENFNRGLGLHPTASRGNELLRALLSGQ